MSEQKENERTVSDRRSEKWHLVKGVPIATVTMLSAQLIVFIYGAASFTFEQGQMAKRLLAVEVSVAELLKQSTSNIAPTAINAQRLGYVEGQVSALQSEQKLIRDDMQRHRLESRR